MRLRFAAAIVALIAPVPAHADCANEVCNAIQKVLDARSGNFAKVTGKPTLDPRGDPVWQGTQPIPGMNACYVNKRGEGKRYEYRCDSAASRSAENSKKIAATLKAALKSAEPNIEWFEDPAARTLSEIQGFQGTEGWYGGYAKNKTMAVKIETIVSDAVGSTTSVTVFAKLLPRRDLR